MKTIIRNGHVLDPSSSIDAVMDLLIEDGKIGAVAEKIEEPADQVIDASGYFVMPGLIDLHVHLRDPGLEYKEDISTGTRAAARGGVTTLCAMPNTKPVVDCPETLEGIYKKADQVGVVHVEQVSAITKGMAGEKLVDMEAMAKAGAIAFSEDGKSVMDIRLYQESMKEAGRLKIPVMAHCEDKNLVGKGVLNEGVASERFGVPGITNSVEDVITARDIFLAAEAGARLHLCHCSTKGAVALTKMAKEMGMDVSAEVCPHHFILTDADITELDSNYKMNPPLRTEEDVKALIQGLADGTMEVISTDHAPHHKDEKPDDFQKAAFGIVGIETSASLTYTALVATGILTPYQMVEKMSTNPARIIGIDNERGGLRPGMEADIAIFDPEAEYIIDPEQFASKGKNTPFAGKAVKGQVAMTLVGGQVVYDRTKEQEK
jgi:dihydroorotase